MEPEYIEPKLIEWQDSYSVGVALIDEQHKKLFTHINDLHLAMSESRDKEILGKLLGDLSDYVDVHFATEEKYMDEFNYEGRGAQKVQHNQYTDKIKSFQEEYAKNELLLSFEIIDFLEDWILSHVTGEDKKYTKCFNDCGLK
jgi:hemerythrin